MNREICLLHANCQGKPLGDLLRASPSFARRWRCVHITNYLREALPNELLSACSLFLYQHLSAKWDELASERVVAKLPVNAVQVCIPNPFFTGYWPFWTNKSSMDFGDVYLDRLVDMGLGASEALYIYTRKPLANKYDLDAMLAESLQMEQQREVVTCIPLLPYVREHWTTRRLFTTISHPSPAVLIRIANGILAHIGLEPLRDDDIAAAGLDKPYALCCETAPSDVFELPIHPLVAAHHGLRFAGEDTQYRVFDKMLTFKQYAACYIECRINGVKLLDFLAQG